MKSFIHKRVLRILTPKRVAFLVIFASLVYVTLFRTTSTYFNSNGSEYAPSVEKIENTKEVSNVVPIVHREPLDKQEITEQEADVLVERVLNSDQKTNVIEQVKKRPFKIETDGICPEIEDIPDLIGPLPQALLLIQNLKENEVSSIHPELEPGGKWSPKDCKARYKVAVIIPFRDRQSHLTRLLAFLIPILKRQRLDFRFIVTEQYGRDLFNKGRIMNAAFNYAETLGVDCVIFHDVDMFPQDDRTPYSCPSQPRHLGAFVSNLGYQLWYKEIVGGVLAISMNDYRTVNGFSNLYYAWGGEDDDLGKFFSSLISFLKLDLFISKRILSLNYTIERPDPDVARYSMLKHAKRQRTAPKLIYQLLGNSEQRIATDGLNQTTWNVRKVTIRPLYYHLFVDVGPVPDEWRAKS